MRLINLFRSNANDLLNKAEDPEKMLNQMVTDLETQKRKVKKQMTDALALQKGLERDLEKEHKEAEKWEKNAIIAVQKEKDELAKEALTRKNEYLRRAIEFEKQLEMHRNNSEILKKKGISISIFDARFAKPLDERSIIELASNHEAIITIEEGSIGGFGSHITKLLSDRGFFDKGLKFRSIVLPDKFLDQDTQEKMYKIAGLDCESIVQKDENVLNSNVVIAKNKNLS